MTNQTRNKLVAVGVGTLVALPLVCLGVALDGMARQGTTLGFLARTGLIAVAIPLVAFVFNYLCDRWERHGEADSSEPASPRLARRGLSDANNKLGPAGGFVTRVEICREPAAAKSSQRQPGVDSRRGPVAA